MANDFYTELVSWCRMIWQMVPVPQEISRMKLLNPMRWNKKLQLQSDQMKQTVSLPKPCALLSPIKVFKLICLIWLFAESA